MQIVFQTPWLNTTGYGTALCGLALGLDARGENVKIDGVGGAMPAPELLPHHRNRLLRMCERPLEHDHITVVHRAASSFERAPAFTIGSTYWETDRLPRSWVDRCNQMDLLCLASRHNIDVFSASGVTVPIARVRNGVFPEMYEDDPSQLPRVAMATPEFRFLSVFKWDYRKGYDLLIRSFVEEFRQDEPVCLVIKTSSLREEVIRSTTISEAVRHLCLQYGTERSAPVYTNVATIPHRQLHQLYQRCHAFVLPSRGEGFGFPYLEAGATGLPVISTGWGGQTEFLTDENAYLVDYDLRTVTSQWYTPFYQPPQKWAEPSVSDLRRHLRAVYADYGRARAKASLLRQHILREFTWEKAAADLAAAMRQLTRHVRDA